MAGGLTSAPPASIGGADVSPATASVVGLSAAAAASVATTVASSVNAIELRLLPHMAAPPVGARQTRPAAQSVSIVQTVPAAPGASGLLHPSPSAAVTASAQRVRAASFTRFSLPHLPPCG